MFHDYRQLSIKNAEREKRGAEIGNEYRSIRPDHRVQQWRRFLSNSENKQQLIHFTVNEWRKERCNVKLAGKKLYATSGEECYEMSSDRSVLCQELRSTYTRGGRHKVAATHMSCKKKWLRYSRDFI